MVCLCKLQDLIDELQTEVGEAVNINTKLLPSKIGLFDGFFLWVVVLYFLFGNIPRIAIFDKAAMVPFTEYLIYLSLIIYCLNYIDKIKFNVYVLGLFLLFLFSFVMGFIKSFVDFNFMHLFESILYNIRILLIVFSSYILGYILSKHYSAEKVFFGYKSIYYAQIFLSLIILFVFPDSTKLWAFLGAHNIIINGDPHQNRLIGVIFHPNFLFFHIRRQYVAQRLFFRTELRQIFFLIFYKI